MAISVALVIVAIYSCEDFVLTRILSTQWLVFVGRISYGIYIFQTSMIFLASKILHVTSTGPITLANGLSLLMLMAVLDVSLSWAHYHFVETRFLKLRDTGFLRSAASR